MSELVLVPSEPLDAFDLRCIRLSSDTCESVNVTHPIQHLPRWKLIRAVRGWHRVLQPGGKLSVSVPNLPLPSEATFEYPGTIVEVYTGPEMDCYKEGFSAFALASHLLKLGFILESCWENEDDIQITARKA